MAETKGMTKGLMLGILAGGVTGGLLGLLYAPKSGRELRRDISSKKNELIEEAGEYFESAKTSAANMVNEGRKKAGKIYETVKKKGEDVYNTGAQKVSGIKDAITSGVESYREESQSGNTHKSTNSHK